MRSPALIDGGMFVVAYGLNPEIVLLLEARREGSTSPAWYCGFARIAIAKVQVDVDSKEIWSHSAGVEGPDDTYWLFSRPIVRQSVLAPHPSRRGAKAVLDSVVYLLSARSLPR